MRGPAEVKYAKDRVYRNTLYQLWLERGIVAGKYRMTIFGHMERAISTAEACTMMGISPRWLRKLRQKGDIPEDIFATVRMKYYTPLQVQLMASFIKANAAYHRHRRFNHVEEAKRIVRARTVMFQQWLRKVRTDENTEKSKDRTRCASYIAAVRARAREVDESFIRNCGRP